MYRDDVYTLAIALAKANGHSDPEAYATAVIEHFDNPDPEESAETEGGK